MKELPSIEFLVNGQKYSVRFRDNLESQEVLASVYIVICCSARHVWPYQKIAEISRDVDAETKLVDFLRRTACLTGTKWMCREGGCGACIVTLTTVDSSGNRYSKAINSCLMPLLSCHGTEITTVEGIGNKKHGYHPLQTQLADMNGTQCGYCSPGIVMSMYSLVQEKGAKNVTMNDVEMSLGGNICRCTGYRPIMDAFKTFANDATPELKQHCIDLEDLGEKLCPKTGSACAGLCHSNGINSHAEKNDCGSGNKEQSSVFQIGNWFRPNSITQLLDVIKRVGSNSNYQLVSGNTGTGVYKEDGPHDAYIDVSGVADLHAITQTTPFTVGGNASLTAFRNALFSIPSANSSYWYGPILAEHIEKIGSVPVRNLGSLAGNLMLKHVHQEFPSDLFIVLETVGAKLNLMGSDGNIQVVSLPEFLQTDMKGKIIYSITLPPLSENYAIKTFKIMPRSCNAHAYINAGFCAKIERGDGVRFIGKPTLIFGGLRSTLIHANKAEEFLSDKAIDHDNFQSSLKILEQELNPEEVLLNPDAHYLNTVAQGLFYKFVLNVLGEKVPPALMSGASELKRGLSSGKQDYETDENHWPVNKPVIKVEARTQTSGEAQFIDDMPLRSDELHGAFVISTVANCYLDNVDPSPALGLEGVIAFFDATNIKASNKFVLGGGIFDSIEDEEVFCSGKVLYAGQPIGLVVANTRKQALRAARLVQIKYKDHKKPVLTFKEAMQDPARVIVHEYFGPPDEHNVGNFDEEISRAEKIIEGEFEMGSQFHFYMETLVASCIPAEDGLDVYCSTQDQDTLQTAIANCLGMQKARVNVQTKRLGGAYGGKASRAIMVGSACAIAANELSRPVRVALDLNTNMSVVNGRTPYYCQYKAGIDKDGLLQAVEMKIVTDCGSNFNEGTSHFAAAFAKNCYAAKAWKFTPLLVKTDTPSYTYCRAPGSSQGIAIIENLMEHLAKACNSDPLEYRLKNLASGENGEAHRIRSIIDHVRSSSDFDERQRQVQEFNRNNRWKKRGINLVPMVNAIDYAPIKYNVLVAIHHNGGSISVSHGGIECGQGINTKVAQVVARELGVDISLISVKPTNTFTNANGAYTGGSTTSELNCFAAMKACQALNERIRPIREKMPDAAWSTLIEDCFNSNVDLTARHYYSALDSLKSYVIHSATVTEVEVDVLTGEQLIRRVDILEDVGQSISPLIDIGQIEGAFMMGIGWWTTEEVTYNPITGEKLNRGTWNYKLPLNRDIPVDFRVTILKNAAHQFGVLRSKATGEPPLCMAVSVLFALRNAIDAARKDAGEENWYRLDGPATVDKLHRMMMANPNQFIIH